MMKKLLSFLILVFLCSISSDVEASPTVSYISSEGFYINGGTNYSLHKNDTLQVMRGEKLVAIIVISNISKNSSACTIIELKEALKIGDKIVALDGSEFILTESKIDKKVTTKKTHNKLRASGNHLSGYISSQHYLITDMTSSSLSSYQPSIRTKLKVDNLFGQNLKLQIKHRSRYYKRASNQYISSNQNNWSHRLYEVAVYSTDKSSIVQWSFGRQSVYQMRGVGFIDGVFVSKRINDKALVGTAVGMEPENINQKINFSRKKVGLFLAYTLLDSQSKRFIITAALAGSYVHSDINREYIYLQTDYTSNKLTFNQSIEIDYYRTWRKESLNRIFSLTSYYGRVNYSLTQRYSFYLSFDTRERIRYHSDVYISDTIFDESNNRGVKFGVRLKPTEKISININTGIRMRANSISNNKYGSISITALRFPQKKSSLTARLSYVESMFTTAYRPSLSIRFPIHKGMYLTINGTTNIYSSSSGRSSTSYIDAQTYYTLSGSYYISSSIRQYFEEDLQSNQFFLEFGKHF